MPQCVKRRRADRGIPVAERYFQVSSSTHAALHTMCNA